MLTARALLLAATADEAAAAAPCICTPRELAALAALFLGMLLDLFGVAEAAGGFHSAAPSRRAAALSPVWQLTVPAVAGVCL